MIDFSKFFGFFRRHEEQSPADPALQVFLEKEARRLHEANPDTVRQWQYLNVVLQRGSVPETSKQAGAFRLLKPAVSYGGILALVLVIAGIVWLNRSSVITYETGKGERSSIMLSDSSEVTLNHTSILVVESRPFGGTRRVSLKGEAFFQVRKNGSPFIIATELGSVQVLGTEFDVRVRGGQLVVGVLSGSVRVSVEREGQDSAVVLTSGQIVTCLSKDFPGAPVALPFADYPGWTQGKFLFYRTSISSACKEIESQFDVQVLIENPRAENETITGVVDGRSAATAVAALSTLIGSKFRHENSVYTLY